MSDLINLFISLVASVEIRNLLEIQNNVNEYNYSLEIFI